MGVSVDGDKKDGVNQDNDKAKVTNFILGKAKHVYWA